MCSKMNLQCQSIKELAERSKSTIAQGMPLLLVSKGQNPQETEEVQRQIKG